MEEVSSKQTPPAEDINMSNADHPEPDEEDVSTSNILKGKTAVRNSEEEADPMKISKSETCDVKTERTADGKSGEEEDPMKISKSETCDVKTVRTAVRNSEEEEDPMKISKSETCDVKTEKTGEHSVTTVNLVLLGLAGTGKSASGNTILGEKLFVSTISSKPVTTECKKGKIKRDGRRVRVIDTPDIFDDEIDSSVRKRHVTKCRQLCQSGPCVYLLVMHVSRFTDGERDILTKLQKAFGSKVHKQTVVLFTRGDDLKYDDISLEEFLDSCQPDLKKVVEKCGNRCVVFENRDSDSHQVEKLMETVNKMLEEQQK